MSRSIRIVLFVVLVAAFICALAVCSAEENSFKTPGSIVTFGRYPQTAEGTDETPIEWIVLEYDEANHRALLLSKYGLDIIPYNNKQEDVTWETCSLRTWLNRDFLTKAFNLEELTSILLTDIENGDEQGYSRWDSSGGNNTRDSIFLLSCAEAYRYLGVEHSSRPLSEQNTVTLVAPTAYAIKQGAFVNSSNMTADGSQAGWWWLRSPGKAQDYAADVDRVGKLHSTLVYRGGGCVRPALWISVE